MYTGQFGIALAGKGWRPRIPLWVLIGAAFGLDLVSTALALAGLEGAARTWMESAAGVGGGAVLIGALYYALAGCDGQEALLVGAVAALHLPADLMTQQMPLWPGGPSVGVALYQHPAADFAVEALVVGAGWLLYRRSLPSGGRRWPAWAALAMLFAAQAMFSFGWRPW